MNERCGIRHSIPEIVCIRRSGHDGLCQSKSFKGTGGTLTYTEWESRNGLFYRHVGYRTIHPRNAIR